MRLAILALSSIAACTPAKDPDEVSRDQLRRRAAFDLGCAENQLRVVTIDDRTKGVSGCGKKAVFVEVCTKGSLTVADDCTWINNTARARSDD